MAITPGAAGKSTPLVKTPVNERYAAFSPDGRWLAYSSEFGGDFRVFVEPYPPTGGKYQLPADTGRNLVWSPDGKQAFYLSGGLQGGNGLSRLMVIDIRTQPSFTFGKPEPLPIDGVVAVTNGTSYDVSPDGRRFIVVMPTGEPETAKPSTAQINIVVNWLEELKARVPAK
jgi:Tol biopolymer transport system component